jgi:hypothetical protein
MDFSIAEHMKTTPRCYWLAAFFTQLLALFIKRLHVSRRNWKSLLVEIFIPALLILIGFGFSKIQLYFSSPERQLSPTLLPWKQRILVNKDLVRKGPFDGDDISPQRLIESLPMYENGAFDVTYKDYSSINLKLMNGERNLLREFDKDIFEARLQGDLEPYRYGSYFVYEANNRTKQFKVASFLNITSQDVTALYPQFMYESILKEATGNPKLKFKVTTAPFPVRDYLKQF